MSNTLVINKDNLRGIIDTLKAQTLEVREGKRKYLVLPTELYDTFEMVQKDGPEYWELLFVLANIGYVINQDHDVLEGDNEALCSLG